MQTRFLYLLVCLCATPLIYAQGLQPGVDKSELLEVMYVSARTGGNEDYVNDSLHPIPEPERFVRTYRSPAMGFDNLWEMWVDSVGQQAILTLRGSTAKNESWLANFYAAMIPAKGEIILPEQDTFRYCFADNPQAAVHAGWSISTAFLYRDIRPVLDSCYQAGISQYIITGHSQGGAISYLLTAQLKHMQMNGQLPTDMHFKSYSTAAPRVGNLYFAYDYERITRKYAFNIINPLDWVPEMPLSVQTTSDFNPINPFTKVSDSFKKQKLPRRIAMNRVYKKLRKHPEKAVQNYIKYLGEKLESSVQSAVGEVQIPDYAPCMHYVRAGGSCILHPDASYQADFPHNPDKIFTHHSHHAYIHLISISDKN